MVAAEGNEAQQSSSISSTKVGTPSFQTEEFAYQLPELSPERKRELIDSAQTYDSDTENSLQSLLPTIRRSARQQALLQKTSKLQKSNAKRMKKSVSVKLPRALDRERADYQGSLLLQQNETTAGETDEDSDESYDGENEIVTLPDPDNFEGDNWFFEASRVVEADLARLDETAPDYKFQLLEWWKRWKNFSVFKDNEAHYKYITKTPNWEELRAKLIVAPPGKHASLSIADCFANKEYASPNASARLSSFKKVKQALLGLRRGPARKVKVQEQEMGSMTLKHTSNKKRVKAFNKPLQNFKQGIFKPVMENIGNQSSDTQHTGKKRKRTESFLSKESERSKGESAKGLAKLISKMTTGNGRSSAKIHGVLDSKKMDNVTITNDEPTGVLVDPQTSHANIRGTRNEDEKRKNPKQTIKLFCNGFGKLSIKRI